MNRAWTTCVGFWVFLNSFPL